TLTLQYAFPEILSCLEEGGFLVLNLKLDTSFGIAGSIAVILSHLKAAKPSYFDPVTCNKSFRHAFEDFQNYLLSNGNIDILFTGQLFNQISSCHSDLSARAITRLAHSI